MARLARLVVPGEVHLVHQNSVGDLRPLQDARACQGFVGALQRAATERGVAVHAYCLLPDRWMLLATPSDADALARMLQAVSRWFGSSFNREAGRKGSLWRGRFVAAPVASQWVLDCLRYVEQMPVQAGLVASADEFVWSSARHHCAGHRDALVSQTSALWSLGNTPFDREAAYRRLVAVSVPAAERSRIEQQAMRGWALGDDETLARWEGSAARRLAPLPRGRHHKTVPN